MDMDTYRANKEVAQKIHERARYLRGRFLNHVAVIERDIVLILTDYFCGEDVSVRFFSLRAKANALVKIVKNDYPWFWDENAAILADLDGIINFRNKLAHSVVDVSEQALARPIEEGIGFVEWKEGEPFTDARFQEWEVKANMVLSRLSDLKALLPFKEKPIP